jgi:hypothetical protein
MLNGHQNPARHIGGSVNLARDVTDPAAAGQPPAHFQRNPPGRGQLAVFPSRGPRDSLDPYESRYGRFVTASPARTALKNSQLTCGGVIIICEAVH